MNAFVPYLAALHQQDLLGQAELRRRAKLVKAEPSIPAWRRRLSGLLNAAARSLDPSVEQVTETALTNGSGASALPAC